MALPAEINSTESNFRKASFRNAGDCGPWTYNGAVFVLCYDDTNDTAEIWWDEAPNRGEGFTEADSANHPAVYTGGSQAHRNPVAWVDGSTVYVIHLDPSELLTVTPFSMATKQWGTAKTGGPQKVSVGQDTGLGVASIPGESLRIVYNGAKVSAKDTVYFVDVDITGAWGTPAILHEGAGTDNYYIYSVLRGIGGRTHCFYQRNIPGDDLYHRSIEPDGTLNSEQIVTSTTESGEELHGWDRGASYYDPAAAALKLSIPYGKYDTGVPGSRQFRFRVAHADSAAVPVWTLEEVATDPIAFEANGEWGKSLDWINGRRYYAAAGIALADVPPVTGAQDLYVIPHNGSAWGSPAVVHNDASRHIFTPRIRPIDIGYGIVFDKFVSGFLKPFYLEVAVDPCPPAPSAERRWPFLRRVYTGR